MKPRIKRYRGRWECLAGYALGFGDTPASAYRDWQRYVRQDQWIEKWIEADSMAECAKSVTQQSKQPPTYGKAEGFTQQSHS